MKALYTTSMRGNQSGSHETSTEFNSLLSVQEKGSEVPHCKLTLYYAQHLLLVHVLVVI